MKYGSDPQTQNWYVCPEYWCLKENRPLNVADMKHALDNKIKLCGSSENPYENIIPEKAKHIPKGKYIYSFVDFAQKRSGQYKDTLYPGLFVGEHPNNDLCIPCCFNKEGGKQERNRKACGVEEWRPGGIQSNIIKKPTRKKIISRVIKEANKFPLKKDIWGFLPMSIYNFLSIKSSNDILCNKDAETCILRRGVEYSSNQSFISCIAAIFNKTYSNKQMKQHILASITIDNFIRYQNGILVTLFKTNKNVSIDAYKESNIYKRFIQEFEGKKYLQDIVSAFINFNEYLLNDKIDIDYEYLWDIICTPNENIFKNGLNLLILNILEDDITQNIGIICPSNHYSNRFFSGNSPTAILLLRDGFYEPIFERQRQVKGKDIIKTFFYQKASIDFPWSLGKRIREIQENMNLKCKPLSSIKQNIIKSNITLNKLKEYLKLHKAYTIKYQIINYNTKTVGIIVEYKNSQVYVPCLPSSIDKDISILFINDEQWWGHYNITLELLKTISKLGYEKKIPCAPVFKVEDDGMIVGIITVTDQFVPVKPISVEDTYRDDLILRKIANYDKVNMSLWREKKGDNKRLEVVQKIKLETNFFNVFRNLVRILLNKYENRKIRSDIEKEISKQEVFYWKKLEKIIIHLKKLMNIYVVFADYAKVGGDISQITKISNCLNITKCNSKFFLMF